MGKILTFLKKDPIRRHVRVVAFGVLGISVGALLFLVGERAFFALTSVRSSIESLEIFGGTDESAYALSPSSPVSLLIPAINLEVDFETPLGLNEDRTIEVPDSYEQVAWYKHSPTPGELGPSVVLGHVDSYKGPAVFFSLGKLTEGDEVFIKREDGTTATFTVRALERYAQDEFPREKVYGDIPYAGLRLVTCTGYYDHGSQRYSHNLVVYAELKDPEAEISDTGV